MSQDYLYRKRAFLVFEKFESEAKTKEMLVQKFQRILNEYQKLKKHILSSQDLDKNFAESSLFIVDLNIKKLDGLIFLASSGSAEWSILMSFVEVIKNKFINSPTSEKIYILNIDKIGDFKKKFFYVLKKYGIINSDQYELIDNVKTCRDNMSLSHLNDYFLDDENFEPKKYNNIKNNQKFMEFKNNSFTLRRFDSFFWNFIQKIVDQHQGYLKLVIQLMKKNNYSYEKITNCINDILLKKDHCKHNLMIDDLVWNNPNDLEEFLTMFQNILDKITNKIGLIHFYFQNFDLINNNKLNPFMKHLMIYFLSSNSPHCELNCKFHKQRKPHEVFLHAEYHLDLIFNVLKNQIYFENEKNPELIKNFKNLMEIELSVFKNTKLIKKLRNNNFDLYKSLIFKIKKIIFHPNYRNRFDYLLRDYFKDMSIIGLPSYWKNKPEGIKSHEEK